MPRPFASSADTAAQQQRFEVLADGVCALRSSRGHTQTRGFLDSMIDRIDTTGAVCAALGAADGEVWLVRPDGHCAAVVNIEDLPGLTAALRRTVGCPDGR